MAPLSRRFETQSCDTLARAKLNLSLRILAREAAGFHQIETIFCRLELADEIALHTTARDVVLDVAGPPESAGPPPDLGSADANLAVRAARLFLQRAGTAGGVAIRLTKRIPVGAGLGGGSSDAGAVLRALNRMAGEPLTAGELVALAGELGSDVPFFAAGTPLALAWGRGGRLLPFPGLPSRPVVLVVPPGAIATADVYATLAQRRAAGASAPAALVHTPTSWEQVAGLAHNDFEDVVFARVPVLAGIREALAADARVARLTGTGSVVFGIFDDAATAGRAAHRIERDYAGMRTILTRTATATTS